MKKVSKNSTSGCPGVTFNKRRKKWTAVIKFNGKRIFLGEYISKLSAIRARKKAERELIPVDSAIGKKFGKLMVVKKTNKKTSEKSAYLYKCNCDCGKFVYVRLSALRDKEIKSCGCLFKENSKVLNSRLIFFNGTNISRIKKQKVAKNNKSGVTGVSYIKSRKKWTAGLMLQNKTIHLGEYLRIEDAIEARKRGERMYFKPIIKKALMVQDNTK